jgi:phenylalanyl-tRNA synthetase beta chain
MIIPLVWLRDYIDIEKTPLEIAKSFTELGLMLEKPVISEVLELEHRMDRADWLSILGCARDLAGFENLRLKKPKLHNHEVSKISESDKVKIKIDSEKVNVFKTRVFKNVEVKDSPDFIKQRLELYGIPSINNIVDITNFVMVELGQPLHAQDLSQFTKREIVLRDSNLNEKIQTLDGTIINLPENTLILSQNNEPICIGGIVGGIETRVTQKTNEIILDAGNYLQSSMRKTSQKIGVRNETLLRSEKFLSPELVLEAIVRATDLILEYGGKDIEAYENSEFKKNTFEPKVMTLTKNRLNLVSGSDNLFESSSKLLEKLEYEIIKENNENITAKIPYFRTDIEVEDDLIADILRMYGYSKIEAKPIQAPVPKNITPKSITQSEFVTDVLISLGFHEHLTDSIVKYDGIENRIAMLNSINSDKDSLRLSIKETLSSVLFNYQKFGVNQVKIFEIGKKYFQQNEDLLEELVIGIIYDETDKDVQSLYLRQTIDTVLDSLNCDYSFKPEPKNMKIINNRNEDEIGYFDSNYAEIYLEKIINDLNFRPKGGNTGKIVTEILNISKEDLTFICHEDFKAGEVLEFIKNLNPLISEVKYLNEFRTEGNRKVTFRFTSLESSEMKRLRTEIINNTSLKFKLTFIS